MRETDGAGEVVGHARDTRPKWRRQQCSAKTGGSWRGRGAGLQVWTLKVCHVGGGRPSSIKETLFNTLNAAPGLEESLL